jgi:hypothetical protein
MAKRVSPAPGDDEQLAVSCSKLLVHRIATTRAVATLPNDPRIGVWGMGRDGREVTDPQTRHDSGQTHLGNELPMYTLSLSMLDHPLADGAASDTRQAQARG